MKITSITTEEFRWPRHVPIRNGKHTYTHSGLGIVKIETDENITRGMPPDQARAEKRRSFQRDEPVVREGVAPTRVRRQQRPKRLLT